MTIDENLVCSFQILRPAEKKGTAGVLGTGKPGTPLRKVRVIG